MSSRRALWHAGMIAAVACGTVAPAPAQEPGGEPARGAERTFVDEPPIERMIAAGLVEPLATRFPEPRSADELELIARAALQRYRIVHEPEQPAAAAVAVEWLTRWAERLADEDTAAAPVRAVRVAGAHARRGRFVLTEVLRERASRWEVLESYASASAAEQAALAQAQRAYAAAGDALAPALARLQSGDPRAEEELLLLGVFDAIGGLRRVTAFEAGWTALYAAWVSEDAKQRAAQLADAEQHFRVVLAQRDERDHFRARIGLAAVLRAAGRAVEAEALLQQTEQAAIDGAQRARLALDRGRTAVAADDFAEAERHFERVAALASGSLADAGMRQFVAAARLWLAVAQLREAERLGEAGRRSGSSNAYARRAEETRAEAFATLSALAERDANWATAAFAVAEKHGAAEGGGAGRGASASELLFRARVALQRGEIADAEKLESALRRRGRLSETLRAEQTVLQAQLAEARNDTQAAAAAWLAFARAFPQDARSEAALSRAIASLSTRAEQSGATDDQRALADALTLLLERFPEHALRAEAQWWLPSTLQAAGDFAAAAEHFEALPADHPRWLTAQLRAAQCAIRTLPEPGRAAAAADAHVERIARLLERVADIAQRRKRAAEQAAREGAVAAERAAAAGRDAEALLCEAVVTRAELFARADVGRFAEALKALDGAPDRLPVRLAGRALAVRLTAHRALGQPAELTAAMRGFLKRVASEGTSDERALGALSRVADAVVSEVDALWSRGDEGAARELAEAALPLFDALATTLPQRAVGEAGAQVDGPDDADARAALSAALRRAHARVLIAAQRWTQAERVLATLSGASDGNGGGASQGDGVSASRGQLVDLRLAALLRDARRGERDRSAARAAADAWAKVLQIKGLRETQPERYHEARYFYLRALLAAGEAETVRRAIEQPRIWGETPSPEPWRTRLDALLAEASGGLEKP